VDRERPEKVLVNETGVKQRDQQRKEEENDEGGRREWGGESLPS